MKLHHKWTYAGFRYDLYETDADVFTASPEPGQHPAAGKEKHIRAAIDDFREQRRAVFQERREMANQDGVPVTGQYLIRKDGYYYRPNCQGYTTDVNEAGRYSLEDAIRYTHPNGKNGPRDGLSYVPEPAAQKCDSFGYEVLTLSGLISQLERVRTMYPQLADKPVWLTNMPPLYWPVLEAFAWAPAGDGNQLKACIKVERGGN